MRYLNCDHLSQFICMLNHHVIVHLFKNHIVQTKYMQLLFVNHTSVKLKKNKIK